MAWLYVPGLVDSNSEYLLPSENLIELSVTLSGKPTLRPLSWRGWKTRPWIKHLSGITLKPSTVSLGVERWISSLPDTPASHSRSRGKGKAKKTQGTSGRVSQESSGKSNPSGSSLRMSQGMFNWDLPMSSVTLTKWGSVYNGVVSAREPLVRVTKEKGYSSWPTPAVGAIRQENYSAENILTARKRGQQIHITGFVKNWATPHTHNTKGHTTRETKDLCREVENWSTPMASDDGAKVTPNSHQAGLIGEAYRFGRPDHQMPKGGEKSSNQTPRLNPLFVEWLMGWPIGWTGSDFAETEWSRWWQQWRSWLSGRGFQVDKNISPEPLDNPE